MKKIYITENFDLLDLSKKGLLEEYSENYERYLKEEKEYEELKDYFEKRYFADVIYLGANFHGGKIEEIEEYEKLFRKYQREIMTLKYRPKKCFKYSKENIYKDKKFERFDELAKEHASNEVHYFNYRLVEPTYVDKTGVEFAEKYLKTSTAHYRYVNTESEIQASNDPKVKAFAKKFKLSPNERETNSYNKMKDRLIKIRENKNLTREEFAKKIGTDVANLDRFEVELYPYAGWLFDKYAKLAEITVDELFKFTDCKQPNDNNKNHYWFNDGKTVALFDDGKKVIKL